jgi:hypothetical protein
VKETLYKYYTCIKKQVVAPTVPLAVIGKSNELEDVQCHKGVIVSHSVTSISFPHFHICGIFCIFLTFGCNSVTLCHSGTPAMGVTCVTSFRCHPCQKYHFRFVPVIGKCVNVS